MIENIMIVKRKLLNYFKIKITTQMEHRMWGTNFGGIVLKKKTRLTNKLSLRSIFQACKK
jgi:hypothetical protein